MTNISYVTGNDARHISKAIEQFPGLQLVAIDYDAHKILNQNNIHHILLDSYLSYDEYGEIDAFAHDLPLIWSKLEVFKKLFYEDINLAEVIEWEVIYALVKFVRILYGVKKVVSALSPDAVIVHSRDDYVSRIIKLVCKESAISVITIDMGNSIDTLFWLDNISVTLDLLGKPVTINISRNTYQKIKYLVDSLAKIAFGSRIEDTGTRDSVVLLDFNLTNYGLLIKELQKKNVNVVLLNQRRPVIWNSTSLRTFQALHLQYNFLGQYSTPSLRKAASNKIAEMHSVFDDPSSLHFAEIFSFKGSTFWPAIEADFISFCKARLAEAAIEVTLGKVALQTIKPKSLLVWSDHSQFEKTMVLLARSNKIRTFVIQHGMLGNILRNGKSTWASQDNKRVYADCFCCWGDITRNWYIKQGIDPARLLLTGSPRYDSYDKAVAQNHPGNILLATSGIPSNTFSIFSSAMHIEQYEKKIRNVCRVAKRFPQQLTVKLHPYADEGFDVIQAVREENPKAVIIKNASIVDVINRSDIVISTGSSVLLEAMLLDKPTIMLRYINGVEQQEISYSEFGASIGSDGDESSIYDAINKILHDKELRNSLIYRGREYANEYLQYRGNATARLADVITR